MTITIQSIETIDDAARQFIKVMGERKIFAFYGAMGAGKTTFIKAICEALGVKDVINSPTFSIVNEYLDEKGNSIFHFDFYRLKREEEAYDIGFDDYVYSGCVCLMEWPELVENLLPEETVKVHIQEGEDGKRFVSFDE